MRLCILQIPEVFCDSSKADAGEEVDGKPSHHKIEAKSEGKLMRDLVSLGLSLGRSPSQHICNVASLVLATSLARPMNSASSFNV